jgi:hypothetical protein
MRLHKLFLTAILIAVFAALGLAQEDSNGGDETPYQAQEEYNRVEVSTRMSEFGKVSEAERRRQLDNFLIELKNNPGASGYILFYQGKDATPSEYSVKGEDIYLSHIRFKNYDESNIVFVNAFRARQTTELWLVPAGGKIPELTETIATLENPKADAFLFHRTRFEVSAEAFMLPAALEQRDMNREEYARDNIESFYGEDETSFVEPEKSADAINMESFFRAGQNFVQRFKTDTDGRGVVIIYTDDRMYDAKKLEADMRARVTGAASQAAIEPAKFEVVFGGYRKGVEIEMWIVPKNAKDPLVKPADRNSNIAD